MVFEWIDRHFEMRRRPNDSLFNLGITQLPETVSSLSDGCCYGIKIRQQDIRESLVRKTIEQAWSTKRSVVMLSTHCDRWHDIIDSSLHLQSGSFRLLNRSRQFAEVLRQSSMIRFLKAIEDNDVLPGSVLLFDEADTFLLGAEAGIISQQMRLVTIWAHKWRHTVIFLFSEAALSGITDHRPASLDSFAGYAELSAEYARLYWHVGFWRDHGQIINQRSYGLFLDPDTKTLSADGSDITSISEEMRYAPDENTVYITKVCLDFDKSLPADWIPIDTVHLPKILSSAVAPTLILDFNQDKSFDQLAEEVLTARRLGARGIKIIVRETTTRLRHYQERLLTHLGANLTVCQYEASSHLLWAVDALKGHCFNKLLPDGYKDLIETTEPIVEKGYLPLLDFCAILTKKLEQDQDIEIRHALVRLYLAPQSSHIEALKAYRSNRSGDVVTSDSHSLFVFYYGCRETDIDIALNRTFNNQVANFFTNDSRITHTLDILSQLKDLKRQWEVNPPADFSLQLI